MQIKKDLLETIISASELKGQIEYNLEMQKGRLHKRTMLIKEYMEKYEPKLTSYRNSVEQVNEIMEFFDKQKEDHPSVYEKW